jgi:hypothetical protein
MSGAGLFEELAEQLGPERAVSSGGIVKLLGESRRLDELAREQGCWAMRLA